MESGAVDRILGLIRIGVLPGAFDKRIQGKGVVIMDHGI